MTRVDVIREGLVQRAFWVHQRIGDGIRIGISQSEETVTESILLDIALQVPNIQVKTFTRKQEAATGADWEWWWEGERYWFGMLVQAKRLHHNTSGQPWYEFWHATRESRYGPWVKQVDQLLEASRQCGLPAIYVLYNGPQPNRVSSCPLGNSYGVYNGVTFITAEVAKKFASHRKVSLAEIMPHARPWSCLLCDPERCPGGSDRPRTAKLRRISSEYGLKSSDLANRAYSAVYSGGLNLPLLRDSRSEDRGTSSPFELLTIRGGGAATWSSDDEWENLARQAMREEPPPYVRNASSADAESYAQRLLVMRRSG
ncbi:DUF6615 family protein [Frankia sp. AgB1.8]|uniref:DUF6615 family protein n=1 Tax=unclassified Frankia TaxID=2632575 RepID=UPI0035A8F34C